MKTKRNLRNKSKKVGKKNKIKSKKYCHKGGKLLKFSKYGIASPFMPLPSPLPHVGSPGYGVWPGPDSMGQWRTYSLAPGVASTAWFNGYGY